MILLNTSFFKPKNKNHEKELRKRRQKISYSGNYYSYRNGFYPYLYDCKQHLFYPMKYSYKHICTMLDETERLVKESRSCKELEIRLHNYSYWRQLYINFQSS